MQPVLGVFRELHPRGEGKVGFAGQGWQVEVLQDAHEKGEDGKGHVVSLAAVKLEVCDGNLPPFARNVGDFHVVVLHRAIQAQGVQRLPGGCDFEHVWVLKTEACPHAVAVLSWRIWKATAEHIDEVVVRAFVVFPQESQDILGHRRVELGPR